MRLHELENFIKKDLRDGIKLAKKEGDTWRVDYLKRIRVKLKNKLRYWYISKGQIPINI